MPMISTGSLPYPDDPADCRSIGPELSGHRFVHDREAPFGTNLVCAERAAGDQRHANGREVVRPDRHRIDRHAIFVGRVMPGHIDGVHVDVGRQRETRRRRNGGDSWQRAERLERTIAEDHGTITVVAVHLQVELTARISVRDRSQGPCSVR